MASQGLLSIINEQGDVLLKVVAGTNCSDGHELPTLEAKLKGSGLLNANVLVDGKYSSDIAQRIYDVSLLILGGFESLVIQYSPLDVVFENEINGRWKPKASKKCLYFTHFSDPNFNPRWGYGTANQHVVAKIS